MKIYFIRHGETNLNREGRLQGRVDEPLNENGRALAEVTGDALRDVQFDLVISSPLSRALETAEILLKKNTVSRPMFLFDSRLMEISIGDWDTLGCTPSNWELPCENLDSFYQTPYEFKGFPNGESIRDVCARTKSFFDDLRTNPNLEDKTVLISTHGCAMRGLLQSVYHDSSDFWHGHVPYNCAVNIVEIQKGEPKLVADDVLFYDENLVVSPYK